MSLIIATGSNLGNLLEHLSFAKTELSKHFVFVAESRIYQSQAVDYENQPDFFNQVLEFSLPQLSAQKVLNIAQEVELRAGRERNIPKGPRTLDIDLLFWGTKTVHYSNLLIPHPRWDQRSFVVLPLQELPYFEILKKCFKIPSKFNNTAYPIN